MRIVSLDPALTQAVINLGLADEIVAISSLCTAPENRNPARLLPCSALEQVDPGTLAGLKPDILLVALPSEELEDRTAFASGGLGRRAESQAELYAKAGQEFKILSYDPHSLEEVYAMLEGLGTELGKAERGRDLAGRLKAQIMDWCEHFYDRMKYKKAVFLSGVNPYVLGARWIPDLIKAAACSCLGGSKRSAEYAVSWEEIVGYKPDVLIVAPRNLSLQDTLGLFKQMEKLPGWDTIPAVKRGEVVFTSGQEYFHRAGMDLIDSMAILVSALAGFESGYITKRDTFYRLRWLELQRHRI